MDRYVFLLECAYTSLFNINLALGAMGIFHSFPLILDDNMLNDDGLCI